MLPNNVEVKLRQFANDWTLICYDIESLNENIMIINKFGEIPALKLNKKEDQSYLDWIAEEE